MMPATNNTAESPSWLERTWRFVSEGIWEVEIHSLSGLKRMGINLIRIVHLVLKGYYDNDCPLHASALTYSSLMSVVPVLALALVMLRGMNAGDWAEAKIMASVTAMPPQFQDFVAQILGYVHKTNFNTLGGIGVALLLWTAVQVLSCVEMSFNKIWGVTVHRPMLRKISDYLSILMVVPVLVMAATTINATLTSPGIMSLLQTRLGSAHFLYSRFISLLPLIVTWLALIFLYKLMPNTKVGIGPAIISGILGGSMWIGWQWVYIRLQVSVNSYNAIYATFASVPIFLFWLYVSWQIVLLGAEIGFAIQNHATYILEQRAHGASAQSRVMLALSIVSHAARSMMLNVPPFDTATYGHEHRVPVRLINEVINDLVSAKLLVSVSDGAGRYVLLKVPDSIRVKDIINIIVNSGSSPQSLGLDRLNPAIRQALGKADTATAEALKDLTVTELLKWHSRLAGVED